MKPIISKFSKSVLLTLVLIVVFYLVLLVTGNLTATTMKLYAGINAMYAFPIIFGNLLFLNEAEVKKEKLVFPKQILKSVGLSMLILFAMNFVLWVIVWGAPLADLFTERNLVFYAIGFCILIVVTIIVHVISNHIRSKSLI